MQDLAGDQVDMTILVTGQPFVQMVETNKIKMIGTLAPAGKFDVPMLKPYPSINDSKLIKNFAFNIWTGFFVKKDTPEAIVQSLNKSLGATLGDPAMRESLEKLGMMVATPSSLADLARQYETETAQFRNIAKDIKLEPL
jgi:tripartite-type tricarboxylate transporter receptor subunit TctC